jgi:hypothetical protein
VAGSCECGDELSGSINCGEFIDWLRTVSFSRSSLLHGVSMFSVRYEFGLHVLFILIYGLVSFTTSTEWQV